MFYYIFLYCCLGIFLNNQLIHYNGIIELTIKPDPSIIKDDLITISNYKKEINLKQSFSVPTITYIDSTHPKNGLSLYHNNNNSYQDLHYQVAKKLLETHMHGIEGIVAHYRGFTVSSDHNGNILFPRLDDNNELPIIITQQINPIVLQGNIPDHFIITKGSAYKKYIASQNIINNDTIAWKIRDDNQNFNLSIPFNAIIIFGNPDLLFFDNSLYQINNSINIILPTLYIKNETENNTYTNLALETLQYFKPLASQNYTATINDQLHTGIILE